LNDKLKMTQRNDNILQPALLPTGVLLTIILLAGLAIRFFLLPYRWINPDEGAHLLDAKLLLQGLIPIADFGSRQPLYVAVLVLFVKIGGAHLWVGRLMPVLASTASSFVLFFLGKKLFSPRAGLIAATVFSLLPLTVIWSTVVKTEPLTIFLSVVSMFFIIRSLPHRTLWNLFFSGMFAAFAFYVRQAALYLPVAAILFLLIRRTNWLRNIAVYTAGYLLVVMAVFLLYSSHLSWPEMLVSQLNPATLFVSRFLQLFGVTPEAYRIVDGSGFRILDQSVDYALNSWRQALGLSTVAVLPAIFLLIFPLKIKEREPQARLFLYLWAGVVLVMYGFQTANRGYYTQYFTEALPPLILLTAAVASEFWEAFLRQNRLLFFLSLPLFFTIFIVQHFLAGFLSAQSVQAAGAVFLTAVTYAFLLQRRPSFSEVVLWLFLPMLIVGGSSLLFKLMGAHALVSFLMSLICLTIYLLMINGKSPKPAKAPIFYLLLFGFYLSALFSGGIGPRYEAVWSPKTLRDCAAILREHGQTGDEVLSGAMIWTFESGLEPFLNVSHPTELLMRRLADFETQFAARPPQFIILDGYTQRKYAKYWDFIEERLDMSYEKLGVITDSKFPVEIYQFLPSLRPSPEFISLNEVRK
jgi:hypothetical protein